MSEPLDKPRKGDACNGCGLCCRMQVCLVGQMRHGPDTPAPCPSLVESHGRTWCGVVIMEPAIGEGRTIASALGIGRGCDSDDE